MDSFHTTPTNIEDDYPGYTTIQQNIIDLLDPADMEYYLHDKSLAPLRKVPVCIAAAVYRMSAGNCMPYTTGNNDKPEDQKLLSFNAYQRNESPWSNYRQKSTHHRSHHHHHHPHHHSHSENNKSNNSNNNDDDKAVTLSEDTSSSSSSCSTLEDSTCSSRSDSPEPKHRSNDKKRSYHMLLREIRRLRGENAFLRSSVSVLKNDLRDCTISRQNADVIHQRTYEEFENRHNKLEEEVLSGQDEIKELKEQIEQLQLASTASSCNGSCQNSNNGTGSPTSSNSSTGLTLHDAAYFKRKASNNVFGCYEFEEDDEDMSCQPVAHESALPEVDVKMDHLKANEEEQVNDYFTRRFGGEHSSSPQAEEEEEEEEEEDELEPFEQVATSYIHQAIVAKLSSARVRLEFDDLILKYEPSTDAIIAVLAESFVNWIKSILQKKTTEEQELPISKLFHTKIQAGIHEFWESILQCYTTEDDYQVALLNHIEEELGQPPQPQPQPQPQQVENKTIIDHFDRLALMLYKYSVVDDAAVTSWWQHPLNNDISKKIRTVTSNFYDWVQDEEEDEESDCENSSDEEESEQEVDEEDEDQVYSDGEHTGFSFTDSPIPELNEEEDTFEFAHEDPVGSVNPITTTTPTTTTQEQQNLEELLTSKERDPCICQFDNDTTTKNNTESPSYKHACLCDSTYYTPSHTESPSSQQQATEKRKKSVRICDVNTN